MRDFDGITDRHANARQSKRENKFRDKTMRGNRDWVEIQKAQVKRGRAAQRKLKEGFRNE